MVNIFDILTTICQCLLIVWTCDNITSREKRLSKFNYYFLILVISTIIIGFTHSNIQMLFSNLIMVILSVLCCVIFYKRSPIDAILGFGIVYSITVISSYFLVLFSKYVVQKMNLMISADLQTILFIFLPSWLIYMIFFKFGKYIFDALLIMKGYMSSLIFFLIIMYTLIVLDTLRVNEQSVGIGSIFKFAFYITTFVVFIFVIAYFARINEKSKEAELLNKALNEKITELRKIKHDYGSEISALYGLYQLGKYDRLGGMLKNIVERSQAVNSSVYVNIQASPLVNSILGPISSSNINLIVFDAAEYGNLAVSDDELFKVLSNIIRNSVDVLNEVKSPIIKFKSYNAHTGVVISISNNGPAIPKEVRDRIFETGFSTKENINGDRGYGLSIVKEIINKCHGRITLKSYNEYTQFNIEIPYKPMTQD